MNPAQDARAFRSISRLLRAEDFDVVHTHSAKAGVLGRVAASRAGVPRIVHTLHGFPWHDFQSAAVRHAYIRTERELSHVTDAYLAIGTGVAVEALRRKVVRPEQLVTIGPAVEPASVTASPASRARARALLGLPADATVVGTVGRMDFQKAPEVMLEALARMATPGRARLGRWRSLLEDTARRDAGVGPRASRAAARSPHGRGRAAAGVRRLRHVEPLRGLAVRHRRGPGVRHTRGRDFGERRFRRRGPRSDRSAGAPGPGPAGPGARPRPHPSETGRGLGGAGHGPARHPLRREHPGRDLAGGLHRRPRGVRRPLLAPVPGWGRAS